MPKFIDRTGEKQLMNCGLMAEIIAYRNATDIDVHFKDGQIVEHRKYGDFKNGSIAPPIDPRTMDRTGEKLMMNCGLMAEIIVYRNAHDIDIRFEDGEIITHKQYLNYTYGNISHPGFNCSSRSSEYYGLTIRFIFVGSLGDAFFRCTCPKCGFETIDTARNIIKMKHQCNHVAT